MIEVRSSRFIIFLKTNNIEIIEKKNKKYAKTNQTRFETLLNEFKLLL
jgi:hypothetical protein